ncbi:phage tail tape measure protein [Bradyrhizobium sp. SZCCHNRI2010]|uniref:phage tail tape measure protein n=1 Tax=Bradyrhizobium sp. SZCCHNRI2010 TaxID=3057283 RepID=UPI0028E8AD75|nr:phage tail tape measure protein [Bradyrhizobium sp. SZCCHNRI2010]
MADENLDIRARLTAEDQASANIKRLLGQIKQLEAQIKKSFAAKPIKGSIVDPDIQTKIQKSLKTTERGFNRLTQEQLRWAREQKMLGRMSSTVWTNLTNDINKNAAAFSKSTGKRRTELARQLRDQIGYARAFRYVYMQEYDRRERATARHHQALQRLELAKQRRDEAVERVKKRNAEKSDREKQKAIEKEVREHKKNLERLERQERQAARERARAERQALEERARARRAVMRGMRAVGYTGDRIRSAGRAMGIGGALSVGGVAIAGRSAIRSATDLDRSEMNARINMDQSLPGLDARTLRDRILPKSVAMGQDPARYMQTVVEAAKAGVPEQWSEKTAEMITQLSKAFGIEPDQAMEGMGYAIAQEYGAGRLKDLNGVRKLGNISAFLAAKTAARPDQMLSFLRTGMGSGAQLGLSQEDTLAFGASAIQAGAQGQQAARFLGSFGSQLFGLDMKARDIRRKSNRSEEDRLFLSLPGKLGFGSYGQLIQQFRKDPGDALFNLIKSFGKIKDPIQREQAQTALFGESFGRFFSNMAQSPDMLDRSRKLSKEAGAQKEENDFLSQSFTEFQKSLEFLIDRIKSVWSVLKAELGDVLKPYVEQLSSWVSDWYNTVRTSGIKERFAGFLRGLTEGFLGHAGTFRDLLDQVFGKPGSGSTWSPEKFAAFGKGMAEGIKSVVAAIGSAGKTVMEMFGKNSSDPEAIGKFTGQIIALVGALTLLAPVVGVFGALVAGITAIATAITAMAGVRSIMGKGVVASAIRGLLAKLGLGVVSGGMIGGLMMGDGRPDNTKDDFDALQNELKKEHDKNKGRSKTKSGSSSGYQAPPPRKSGESMEEYLERLQLLKRSSYTGSTDFSGRRRTSAVEDLADEMKKFGGKVELASFRSGISSAFGSTGGAVASSFGGGSGARMGVLASGSGSPTALFNSTPGGVLPNFGVGQGGIIRHGMGGRIISPSDVPSFSGGGGSSADDGVGAGLGGSEFLKARRARFADELKNDPNLRLHLAAMQLTEGASKGGTIESLMNRADMQGKTLRQMLGFSADGKINPKSFYGPIRRGEIYGAIEKLKRNPSLYNKFDTYTQHALEGGHVIGGYTDQGLPTDPNGSRRTGIPGFKISPKDGNEFTDWVGPGSSWGRGRAGAMNYRRFIEKGISGETAKVPSPADITSKVPPPAYQAPGGGDARMGNGGQVAININGGSHDPHALALLVQRRIDEQMNWRAHDTESEYT